MGFLRDKRSPFDFPPGAPAGQQHRFEERNRFGLRIHWCFADDDLVERMAEVRAIVRESVAVDQFGEKTAKGMFLEELDRYSPPPLPSPGRPPHKDENDDLLEQVGRLMVAGKSKARAIRTVAAENVRPSEKVRSLERKIWDLFKKRKEVATLAEEAQRAQAKYEHALAKYRKKLVPTIFDEIESESTEVNR
jgi:hypothetical protein